MRRIPKGNYGYLKFQKKYEVIKTIIFFLIPLSMFFAGWYTTKSRMNLLTVVAILGMLPACKNAVVMIMTLKSKGISEADYHKVAEFVGELTCCYDMNVTTYNKTYRIGSLALRDKTIVAYCDDSKADMNELEKYMKQMLEQNAYKGYSFKCFTTIQKYTDRLKQLQELPCENPNMEYGVKDLMLALSL